MNFTATVLPYRDLILLVMLIIILVAGLICMRLSRKRKSNRPMYFYWVGVLLAAIPMFFLTRM